MTLSKKSYVDENTLLLFAVTAILAFRDRPTAVVTPWYDINKLAKSLHTVYQQLCAYIERSKESCQTLCSRNIKDGLL